MKFCSINFCKNNIISLEKAEKFAIFRFDRDDGGRKHWVDIINNIEGQCLNKINKIYYICELHFQKSDLIMRKKITTIKKNAVPTIFPLESNLSFGEDLDIADYTYDSIEINGDLPQLSNEDLKILTITDDSVNENVNPKQLFNEDLDITDQIRYPGDINIDAASENPQTSLRALKCYKHCLEKMKKKVKTLSINNAHQKKTIKSLRHKIKTLKPTTIPLSAAKEDDAWEASELIKQLKTGCKKKYNKELRIFALTVYYYSPRCYEYLRSSYFKNLPSPRTLRYWYQSIDAEPGLTKESLAALKIYVSTAAEKGKKL